MTQEMPSAPLRDDLALVQWRDAQGSFVIQAPGGGHFRVNAATLRVLKALDGTSTPSEIASRLGRRHGDVARVAGAAASAGLLRAAPHVVAQPSRARSSLNGLGFKVFAVAPGKALGWLADRVAGLFSIGGAAFLGVAVSCACVAIFASWNQFAASFASLHWFNGWLSVWLLLVFSTAVHELGHMAACRRFGVAAKEVGLMIYLFQPMAFADVSASWTLRTARERIVVALGGVYLEAYLFCVGVAVWSLTPAYGAVNQVAFVTIAMLAARALLNVYPFLRLDGYWILCDLLGITNLREKAFFHVLCSLPRQRRWQWRRPPPPRQRLVLIVYGSLAIASVCAMFIGLGAGLWFWLDEYHALRAVATCAFAGLAIMSTAVTCKRRSAALAAAYGQTAPDDSRYSQ